MFATTAAGGIFQIYWVGPFLGGALGVVFYTYFLDRVDKRTAQKSQATSSSESETIVEQHESDRW